jgi:hypothetical protein
MILVPVQTVSLPPSTSDHLLHVKEGIPTRIFASRETIADAIVIHSLCRPSNVLLLVTEPSESEFTEIVFFNIAEDQDMSFDLVHHE